MAPASWPKRRFAFMSSLAGADKKQGCPACLSLPTPVASLLVSIPLMALRLPPLYCFFFNHPGLLPVVSIQVCPNGQDVHRFTTSIPRCSDSSFCNQNLACLKLILAQRKLIVNRQTHAVYPTPSTIFSMVWCTPSIFSSAGYLFIYFESDCLKVWSATTANWWLPPD